MTLPRPLPSEPYALHLWGRVWCEVSLSGSHTGPIQSPGDGLDFPRALQMNTQLVSPGDSAKHSTQTASFKPRGN